MTPDLPTTTAAARAALVRTSGRGYMTREGRIVYVRRLTRPLGVGPRRARWTVEVPRPVGAGTVVDTATPSFLAAARRALTIAAEAPRHKAAAHP